MINQEGAREEMREIDRQDVIPEPEYSHHQAREKVNAGEYQRAMDIIHRAITIATYQIHSLIEIGIVTNISIQSDKTIPQYEKVIQVNPFQCGYVWFNKGRSMEKKRETKRKQNNERSNSIVADSMINGNFSFRY